MEDKKAVKLLKRNDEQALELIIKAYTGYVSTVISNQLGGFCDLSAVEELTSDIFAALWQNRMKLSTAHLRGWLGAAARNRARSYLRSMNTPCESLEEDYISFPDDSPFNALEQREQSEAVYRALENLKPHSKEIIIRYYYYNQTIRQIADEMELNPETVKSRLQRGREKLKTILEKGGYFS